MAHGITVEDLLAALASAHAPRLFDVRRAAVFAAAESLVEGAAWRDPEQAEAWARELVPGSDVVVYCVHGHHVSQGCAERLREAGLHARFLEGGFEAWKAAGGPLQATTGATQPVPTRPA